MYCIISFVNSCSCHIDKWSVFYKDWCLLVEKYEGAIIIFCNYGICQYMSKVWWQIEKAVAMNEAYVPDNVMATVLILTYYAVTWSSTLTSVFDFC